MKKIEASQGVGSPQGAAEQRTTGAPAQAKPKIDITLPGTRRELGSIRDFERDSGKSPVTVNMSHKVVAGALGAAVRMGSIGSNPAAGVDYLPEHAEKIEKGTFAPEEVSLLVDAAPSDDWKGVIRIGYYAGLRLGDALSIRWGDIDLQHCLLTFIPRETARLGKELAIPLHPEIERFFFLTRRAPGTRIPFSPPSRNLESGDVAEPA